MRMEEEAVQSWLEKNGYKRPLIVQYSEWLGNALTGRFWIFHSLQKAC